MIRAILGFSLLALAALADQPAHAETPVACEATTHSADHSEIACPLLSAGATEWRFRADFTGVHADSAASLKVSVDGQLVTCGPGSTLELAIEVVEQSLECRLVVEGRAAAEQKLLVEVRSRHAQQIGHELVAVAKP